MKEFAKFFFLTLPIGLLLWPVVIASVVAIGGFVRSVIRHARNR